MQLDLPIVLGEPIPVLYIQMDGTGMPVVKTETQGRHGFAGQPAHTREAKLGCASHKPHTMRKATRSAIRTPPLIPEPLKPPPSSASACIWKLGTEAGATPSPRSSWATARSGSGTSPASSFRVRFKSSIFITPANTYGMSPGLFILWTNSPSDVGSCVISPSWTAAGSENWSFISAHVKPQPLVITIEDSYFEKNAARMRYPEFRQQHLFVGSGVIEAGCKTVFGQLLKQSGMFWTVRGANAILALRCRHLNARFESYWEARAV